jgi:hypothetical protein
MFETRRAITHLAALVLTVAPSASAQSEKVSLGLIPASNQSIRFKMTQDTNMEMAMTGPAASGDMPQGPMKLLGTTVFEGTQIVSNRDAEGRVSLDFTYDQVTSTMTMNGSPVPSQNAINNALKGKKVTIVFDAQGRVVDFKVPDELAVMAPNLKELMTSMMGGLPAVSLGVGETVTLPLNIALPFPIPGAAPVSMVGQRTFTLLSLNREGAERIARLEQKTDTKLTRSMEMPGPNGPSTTNLDFKMAGSGTMEWNLDRGYVTTSDTASTIDGTLTGPLAMTIRGTIRIVTEGSPIR